MLIKSAKFLIYSTSLLMALSCGKSSEQEIKDNILSANIHLSKRECQSAIDLLEGMGRQNKNAYYLKALSSAYACRAGYSTTKFFADDVALTATPSPLGGMTKYSTSLTEVSSPLTEDSDFRDLQTAIDILLYAGGIPAGTDPTISERAQYFSATQAGDINAQLAYMLLAQTGKLMKVYSNASADGIKGDGSGANTCFTDYSDTSLAVQTFITAGNLTGKCKTVDSSHPDLELTAPDRRKKLCEGVVLLNNILTVLPGVLATAGGGDLDDIASVTEDIEKQKKKLVDFDTSFGTTATVLSQTKCENSTAITEDTLASYFAVFYESLVL